MTNNNTIAVNYRDERLRVLVEEYIIQQRGTFTLKGACSYILYWAMEEGCTVSTALYESNQLATADRDRVKGTLSKIVAEGRITSTPEGYIKIAY